MKKDLSSPLVKTLAQKLVVSHLNAWSESEVWDQIVQQEVLKDSTKVRTIAVVGAGASAAVNLPITNCAVEQLKKRSEIPQRLLDAEIDRLVNVYRLERDVFETILLALSTNVYSATSVRGQLYALYHHRFMPVLCYEILAHLLKHRFLDAIINFNFDELLDQSIADELEPWEYYHIVSDGDCPADTILLMDRLDRPYYIKPHGTAGHKSTLRFTREDYYGLPSDIRRVIQGLVADKTVVLLVIGFNMQSFEFNQILNKADSNSSIYYINLNRPAPDPPLNSSFGKVELIEVDKKASDEQHDVASAMKAIWSEIDKAFLKPYKPRQIERHLLVSETFSRDVDKYDKKKYLRARTILEICLAIAKGKGLVNMSELASGRSGKYFSQYKKLEPTASFFKMCTDLGLYDIGYSREALKLRSDSASDSKAEILNKEEFKNSIDGLYRKVSSHFDKHERGKLTSELFRSILLNLYADKEVEIRTQTDSLYDRIFANPELLRTESALAYHTLQAIDKMDWKYLLVVAETGEWMVKEHIVEAIKSKPNSHLYLILADLSWKSELETQYADKIACIRSLPWWDHNRHMTLFVDKEGFPRSGIYFVRRLRAQNIVPIWLSQVEDCEVILESFIAYWRKAELRERDTLTYEEISDRHEFFKELEELAKLKEEETSTSDPIPISKYDLVCYLKANEDRTTYTNKKGLKFKFELKNPTKNEDIFPYTIRFHSKEWKPETVTEIYPAGIDRALMLFNEDPTRPAKDYRNLRGSPSKGAGCFRYLLEDIQKK